MLLDPQEAPLAVVLPGSIEGAKKNQGYLFKGEYAGKFQPESLSPPVLDPKGKRRKLPRAARRAPSGALPSLPFFRLGASNPFERSVLLVLRCDAGRP